MATLGQSWRRQKTADLRHLDVQQQGPHSTRCDPSARVIRLPIPGPPDL